MVIPARARRISKIFYFIALFFAVGRAFPKPDIYINNVFAEKICNLLFGSVNADSMYDTSFYIDMSVMLFTTTVIYALTMTLIKNIRNK